MVTFDVMLLTMKFCQVLFFLSVPFFGNACYFSQKCGDKKSHDRLIQNSFGGNSGRTTAEWNTRK